MAINGAVPVTLVNAGPQFHLLTLSRGISRKAMDGSCGSGSIHWLKHSLHTKCATRPGAVFQISTHPHSRDRTVHSSLFGYTWPSDGGACEPVIEVDDVSGTCSAHPSRINISPSASVSRITSPGRTCDTSTPSITLANFFFSRTRTRPPFYRTKRRHFRVCHLGMPKEEQVAGQTTARNVWGRLKWFSKNCQASDNFLKPQSSATNVLTS